jgi:uncharacterized membrane protein YeaQ/YmgE (transglycosylase-associated protein family)
MFFTHILADAPAQITITTGELVYVAIAAIVGLIAEFIVGWRLPFGIIGAIIAALVGIWLFTNVIVVTIPDDYVLTIAGQSVPLLRTLLGAIVVVALWHILTFPTWRRRERYYRGYRNRYYRDRY